MLFNVNVSNLTFFLIIVDYEKCEICMLICSRQDGLCCECQRWIKGDLRIAPNSIHRRRRVHWSAMSKRFHNQTRTTPRSSRWSNDEAWERKQAKHLWSVFIIFASTVEVDSSQIVSIEELHNVIAENIPHLHEGRIYDEIFSAFLGNTKRHKSNGKTKGMSFY